MPQALPDGELSGVFRSPCASIQTTRDAAVAARELAHRADVRAAAAAEHERPLRQLARRAPRSARRASSSSTIAASGHGSSVAAASAIASPPSPQRARARARARRRTRGRSEWHWYSGPIATAVSVRQSGHFARRRASRELRSLERSHDRLPQHGHARRARRAASRRSGSPRRHRGAPCAARARAARRTSGAAAPRRARAAASRGAHRASRPSRDPDRRSRSG